MCGLHVCPAVSATQAAAEPGIIKCETDTPPVVLSYGVLHSTECCTTTAEHCAITVPVQVAPLHPAQGIPGPAGLSPSLHSLALSAMFRGVDAGKVSMQHDPGTPRIPQDYHYTRKK